MTGVTPNVINPKMVYNNTSILVGIRNFNLMCGMFGHKLGKPVPFLNSSRTGYCGNKRKCTRCTHEVKEYN